MLPIFKSAEFSEDIFFPENLFLSIGYIKTSKNLFIETVSAAFA